MDNRITGKRLSNFFAYEWILLIFICVAVIFAWELIYSVSGVRLTVGQNYKFFYDYYMDYDRTYEDFYNLLDVQDDLGYSNGKSFSYDIQKVDFEKVYPANDVMSTRIHVHDGDILFTDDSTHRLSNYKEKQVLAKFRVDSYGSLMVYDKLLADAQNYLRGFLLDGVTEIDAQNLDLAKIKKGFEARLGEDNRFRAGEQKEMGVMLEKQRLENLCKEVSDFEKIMSLPSEYFFTYTRFEQARDISVQEGHSQQTIDDRSNAVQAEKDAGRENARYGLRVDKISEIQTTGVNKNPSSKYFRWVEAEDATVVGKGNNVVVMVFDFSEHQADLQFESISVINNIVRAISSVLD